MNAKVLLAAFSVSILGCALLPAFADTETVIRTTTIMQPGESASTTEFVLSCSGNYVVVDPLTGAIEDTFPARSILAGLYWTGRTTEC